MGLSTSLGFRFEGGAAGGAGGGVPEPGAITLDYANDFSSDIADFMFHDGTTRDDDVGSIVANALQATATNGPRAWNVVDSLTVNDRYVIWYNRFDGGGASVLTGFETTDPADSGTTNFDSDGGSTADGANSHEFVASATSGYVGFRTTANTTITVDNWGVARQGYQDTIPGQDFDGTNDYLQIANASLGAVDRDNIIIHLLFSTTETNTTQDRLLLQNTSTGMQLRIQDEGGVQGRVRWRFENGSGGVIWEGQTNNEYNDGAVYEAFLRLKNTSGSAAKEFWIGPAGGVLAQDQSDITTTNYGNGNAIDFTKTNYNIGSQAGGAGPLWDGGIYRFAFTNGATSADVGSVGDAGIRQTIRGWADSRWITLYEGDDWATTGNQGFGADWAITGSLGALP